MLTEGREAPDVGKQNADLGAGPAEVHLFQAGKGIHQCRRQIAPDDASFTLEEHALGAIVQHQDRADGLARRVSEGRSARVEADRAAPRQIALDGVTVYLRSGGVHLVEHRRQLAVEEGCERVYRVNGVGELPSNLSGIVGLTAGASAPEELVEAVIDYLAPADGVELVNITDEDEYFPPPRNIRDLQSSIEMASTVLLGGSLMDRPGMDDRCLVASDVLASLAT